MDKKKDENNEDADLDDLLEKQWEMQDQIHRKCKMKDNPEEKFKKWKQKYD
jgi:hypothetical protein